MYGILFGDIAGMPYEGCVNLDESIVLCTPEGSRVRMPLPSAGYTDDSVLTIAIAEALLMAKAEGSLQNEKRLGHLATQCMTKWGREYPNFGYGAHFMRWLYNPVPYGSCGNGSAMRVGPAGMIASSKEEAEMLARAVTVVSHDHAEGIRGAVCTAVLTYMAGKGTSKEEMYLEASKYYNMNFSFYGKKGAQEEPDDDIWLCQGAVPIAIRAFLESTSYEDMIIKLIGYGGDTDTTCAIAGAFGGLYYKMPEEYVTYVDDTLRVVLNKSLDPRPVLEAFLCDAVVSEKWRKQKPESEEPFGDYAKAGEACGKIAIPVIANLDQIKKEEKKNLFKEIFQGDKNKNPSFP